ncbi:hypothetical protein AB1Y20_019650 [Prymnesium parvum]|uniref:SHOCT domain-containing protein n=1 Tax=Prymnesium parvum TaxID=97485 RepID=A0AB34JUN1_PRYPA
MAPPAAARAVVLYGRVGTYQVRTASLKKGMPADHALWHACAATIRTHVVLPWRAAGRVDLFVQSWNPELSSAIDAFWAAEGLVASLHQPQNGTHACRATKLNYCERTAWALLGMKRALALRTAHAAGGGRHAAVLVMRHDVLWSNSLPPLRADRGVRLWLPFDCKLFPCAAHAPHPPHAASCEAKARASNWTLLAAKREVLSLRCDKSDFHRDFCGHSVNVDWWWAGDEALADDFHQTFDQFAEYSRLIKGRLRFHNSAPHHYWGLFFFHFHRLRERCQLGHAMLTHTDFTLGRFVPQGSSTLSCSLDGWRALWRPPADCNASALDGYLVMCPGAPRAPLRRRCSVQPPPAAALPSAAAALPSAAVQPSAAAHGHRKAAQARSGGGGAEAAAAEAAGRKGVGHARGGGGSKGHASGAQGERGGSLPAKPKGGRERLLELQGLRDAGLISEEEYATLRQKARRYPPPPTPPPLSIAPSRRHFLQVLAAVVQGVAQPSSPIPTSNERLVPSKRAKLANSANEGKQAARGERSSRKMMTVEGGQPRR